MDVSLRFVLYYDIPFFKASMAYLSRIVPFERRDELSNAYGRILEVCGGLAPALYGYQLTRNIRNWATDA